MSQKFISCGINLTKHVANNNNVKQNILNRGNKIFVVPETNNKNNNKFYKLIRESYLKNNSWGMATSIDCSGCTDTIKDKDKLHDYVLDLCKLIDMKRFGECQIVHFGEDKKVEGYSLVQLIETSCISGHFANSTNSAYIDIFSCKPYNPVDAVNFTKEYFGSKNTNATVVLR